MPSVRIVSPHVAMALLALGRRAGAAPPPLPLPASRGMRRRGGALRHLSRHLSGGGAAVSSRPLRLPDEPGEPSEPPFGLEMDVDLSSSAELTPAVAASVRDSLHRHGLLLFRRQSLTPERQIEVTEACWGAVEPHPLATRPGLLGDRVLVMQNGGETQARGARNDFWHSDISNVERPPMVSCLHALEVPEGKGDTLFVNMATCLAGCSPELQRALESLAAVHSSAAIVRRNNAEGVGNLILSPPPPVRHPVVRSHPVTGERALYVNEFFTERFSGMSEEESAPLLAQLMAEATRPERVYRHCWRPGDLLVWDNALLMHYAVLDYDATDYRLMHRTTAAAPHCGSGGSGGGTQFPLRPSLEQQQGGGVGAPKDASTAVDAKTLAQLLL